MGGGRRVVAGCSKILINNKAVVDPWSPVLCSECRQCVVMFLITTANLLTVPLSARSGVLVPSAGDACGML